MAFASYASIVVNSFWLRRSPVKVINMNKLERLERTLGELKESSSLKLVEGKRDKKALEAFGIDKIRIIHGPLPDLVDKLRETEKEIILLTDFDRRGELIKKRLVELCENDGIEVDLSYRRELRRLTGLNTIEELASKYENILEKMNKKRKGDFHGKDLYRYSKICGSCRSGNRRDS